MVYAWGDSAEINATSQIWLKRFDRDSPTKLAESYNGEIIGRPVWSPDGKQILYKSQNPRFESETPEFEGALWLMAADGSARRKLLTLELSDLSTGPDWSPDGTRIAYSNQSGSAGPNFSIQILTLASGQVRKITEPPASAWGDWDPKFSLDGNTIVFKRVANYHNDSLFAVPVQGGAARELTKEKQGIWGHAWTLDGHGIIFSRKIGGLVHGLWLLNMDHPGPAQPIREPGTDEAVMPTARGNKVAWVNQTDDYNIYRVPVAGGRPSLVIGSTSWDYSSAIAADGRIAFASRRSGSEEIWLAAPDGSNAVRVTDLRQPVGHFAWSPDGVHLLFDTALNGFNALRVIDCEIGKSSYSPAVPVGDNSMARQSPSWSLDGRLIYFSSQINGNFQVFRMPAQGGAAVQLTHGSSGEYAQPSPDGKWLYFCKPSAPGPIWRMSLDSNAYREEMVVRPLNHPLEGHFKVTNSEVIFVDQGDETHPAGIRAYNVATRQVRTIVQTNGRALSVSHDGRMLYYSQSDRSGGNVMIANWNH